MARTASRLLVKLTALAVCGCGISAGLSPVSVSAGPPAADLVLRGGAVYTVNPTQPWAEAVAVLGGEIVFVGDSAGALAHVGTGTHVIDLAGRVAMPGLHDSHVHILEAFHPAGGTCFLPAGAPPESHIQRLLACAPNQIGTDWVLGYGYSIYDLLDHVDGGGRPPVEILDEAIPDQPAAMLEETSHSVWVNSLALQAAGIDRDTPNPPGGVIVKDAGGEPNGILLDGAGELVMDLAFAPNPELEELNYAALLDGLDAARRQGITSLVDARAHWRRGYVEAYQRAQVEGRLSARAILSLWAYPYLEDTEQIATLASMYSNDPASLLRLSQIKIYSDGEIGHTTAALLDPYLCCALAGPTGLEYFDQARLERYVTELELVGFDFHIHAIGDRGVHQALDAVEAAAATNCVSEDASAGGACAERRHRITHVETVQPSDVPRFAELGVTADLQMSHMYVEPTHLFDYAFLLGAQRILERTWRLRDLHEAGARVVLSSDYDVGELSPWSGMQRALTRGDQSLPDLGYAIRAYTIDAAHLMRQEHLVGSIEVGKLADIVVLDRNPFELDPADLGTVEVSMTLLAGELVWGGTIFADGFETGGTGAWSTTVP
ncbi:MAG: amidohydrolase [bacterium]|nr:amidohydrolase [bacterium]